MRGFLVSMLIWSAVAQASSACPACQARIGEPLVAPAHAHGHHHHHHHLHHSHAAGAPIAGCPQCAAGYGCDPYGYGYRYCSPTDPQLFYAELYRRFYLELDRLKLNVRNKQPVSPQPGY